MNNITHNILKKKTIYSFWKSPINGFGDNDISYNYGHSYLINILYFKKIFYLSLYIYIYLNLSNVNKEKMIISFCRSIPILSSLNTYCNIVIFTVSYLCIVILFPHIYFDILVFQIQKKIYITFMFFFLSFSNPNSNVDSEK